jgi:hypothetical protein
MADLGEDEVNRLLGGADTVLASVNVRIKQDEQTLNNLKLKFESIKREAEGIAKALKEAGDAAQRLGAGNGQGGAGGVGQIGNTKVVGGLFTPTPIDKGSATRFQSWLNTPLGGKGPQGGGGMMMTRGAALASGAQVANQVFNATMGAIDSRVDRNREYSLAADRTSVLFQQMTGMSQAAVQNTYRQPLTQYRLGAGGINALMGLEATTGISGRQQASSVEAMRTMSGFTMSGEAAVGLIGQLSAPETVNRMFMMTGQSLVGPGGKTQDTMSLMKGLVKSAGLTDPRILKGALAQGSMTRANLTQMGVTGEFQTQLIQYAQENQAFNAKGGKGMYDPSKKEDRKLMGIEGNFATQKEETDRTRTEREENFYSRQTDNFADLEKQTQSLIKTMGKFEDKMSGIIGARTSNRIGMKVGGMVGTGLGTAIGTAFGVPMIGGALGGMAGNLIGGMFGDPPETSSATPRASTGTPEMAMAANENSISIPYGYRGQRKTITELRRDDNFKKLNPKFQERLISMFKTNPNVGYGGGFRTNEQQRSGFTSRYKPVDYETDVFFEGQYWEHVSGAGMAPPGRSMHEIGLAVDLVGDTEWVSKNIGKFKLVNFEGLDEPWHVQPAELPKGRGEYEKMGAPWGRGEQWGAAPYSGGKGSGSGTSGTSGKTVANATADLMAADGGGKARISPRTGRISTSAGSSDFYSTVSLSRGSISDKVKRSVRARTGGTPSYPSGTSKTRARGGNSTGTASVPTGGGALAGRDVAQYLYNAGFRGQDLINALAISWRESRWNPSSLTKDSDDESYGLMQINMLPGATNPEGNRAAWGITSNDALLDPATNARIAFEKYSWNKNHGRDPFQDWVLGGNPLNGTDSIMPQATQIIQDMGKSGDPMPRGGRSAGSSSPVSLTGGATINIAPTINFTGGSSAGDRDLEEIARKVGVLLEREVIKRTLRQN